MYGVSNASGPLRCSRQRQRCSGLLPATALALGILCASCLAVPVKAPRTKGPGGEVSKGKIDLGFLQEGVTRREEVVQQIGWLDVGFKSDRLFVARWLDSEWVVYWGAIGMGTSAGGAERQWKMHTLFIEFDESGIVKRFALSSPDLLKEIAIWTSGEPPLVLDPPLEVSLSHWHKHSGGTPSVRLRLARDSLHFQETGNAKHNFSVSLADIQRLEYRGAGLERGDPNRDPVVDEVQLEIRFSKKTAAGKRVTLLADFPTFITLLRYANLTRIAVK